jgi:hypothetical protein
MVGILVHGNNHFILPGPLPEEAAALALVRHWSIVWRGEVVVFRLSGQVKTGHTWSLQNRPYGPGLRCCTLPFAFLTSLISEISKWRAISSSKLEKISFTGPWGHFLEVSHSLGRAFPAGFRRDAHSAGNLVLQLRGPHLRIWP